LAQFIERRLIDRIRIVRDEIDIAQSRLLRIGEARAVRKGFDAFVQ